MNYSIEGTMLKKYDTAQITDTFKKREFVLEVEDGQYTQLIKMQLTQDNVTKIDSVNVGDKIAVRFNIRGREYTKDGNTSYFNNLEAWKIEHGATVEAVATTTPTETEKNANADDLPF